MEGSGDTINHRGFRLDGDRLAALALMGILLLAFLLRCRELEASAWIDEAATYRRSSLGLSYAWSATKHPITYVLAYCGLLLEDSDVGMRLPILLSGVAGVAAVFALGVHAGGRSVGILAALGLALSAYHIRWSQDARYYAPMMLLGILLFWALSYALSTNRLRFWLAYVLVVVLGVLNQPFFVPLVCAAMAGGFICAFGSTAAGKRRAVRLVLCTIAGLAVCVLTCPGIGELVGAVRFERASASVQTPPPSAIAKPAAELFTLSPHQYYVEFSREYFMGFENPRWLWCVALGLGICGAVAMCRRRPSLGIPLVTAILLLPIPFFFVPMNHFLSPRYFSTVVPMSIVLVSTGAVALGEQAARLGAHLSLQRLLPVAASAVWRKYRKRSFRYVALGAVLAIFASPMLHGLDRYYDQRPERDWRKLVETMAPTLTPDDLIIYCSPGGMYFHHLNGMVNYYFARYVPSGFGPSVRREWCDSREKLAALLEGHRGGNIWLVTDCGWPLKTDLDDWTFVTSVFPVAIPLSGNPALNFALRTRGEPTTNLCTYGGFEGRAALDNFPGVDLPAEPKALSGLRSARLQASSDSSAPGAHVSIPVEPDGYALRNADFEAWRGGMPLGWTFTPGAILERSETSEISSGTQCALFTPSDREVMLRQALPVDPTPELELEATILAKAAEAHILSFGVEYTHEGERKSFSVSHPGDGNWKPLTCRFTVPEDADSGSFALVVRQAPGATGCAVDNAALRFTKPILDSRQHYTLSLWVRYLNTSPVRFTVSLSGREVDGQPFSSQLLEIQGTGRDWYPLACEVEPGVNLPRNPQHLQVDIAVAPGEGEVWVDNVQFEAKDHPTQFVQGTRSPHDEHLALVEAEGFSDESRPRDKQSWAGVSR